MRVIYSGWLDLDRTAWLMLLCFPPDVKNFLSLVDKSFAGFAQLLHVHRSSTASRLIVKFLVNKAAVVSDSLTLSVGTYPRVRSWTVSVNLLSASDVVLGGDEAPLPRDGPVHPIPHPAPSWMGPPLPHGQAAEGNVDEVASDNGGAAGNVDAEMEDVVQGDPNVDANAEMDVGRGARNSPFSGALADFAASGGIKSLSPKGPSVALNQVITLLRLLPPPLPICCSPFNHLSSFVIDLSTKVPSYITGETVLWFLAKVVMVPDEVGQPLERVEVGENDEVSIISKEEATSSTKKPKKRRARKPRAPLSQVFVRRSKRLNADLEGFRTKASKEAHVSGQELVVAGKAQSVEMEEEHGTVAEVLLKPRALAMVPATGEAPVFYVGSSKAQVAPAPYLSMENVQAMASGFLKMQPSAVSTADLLDSSDDE
ncbi:unnamed protein product [Urochloa humidicola]